MNDLSPGAYASMTKVDFAALDKVLVNPQSVYGARSEIVRFLEHKGAITKAMYACPSTFDYACPPDFFFVVRLNFVIAKTKDQTTVTASFRLGCISCAGHPTQSVM